jgi:hypothetical protein
LDHLKKKDVSERKSSKSTDCDPRKIIGGVVNSRDRVINGAKLVIALEGEWSNKPARLISPTAAFLALVSFLRKPYSSGN